MAKKYCLSGQPTINWGRLIFFVAMAATTIIGLPLYVTRHRIGMLDMGILIFWMVTTSFSITMGYHRLFSHRTFKTNQLVTFLCLFFGAAAFENSALQWACEHRNHHRYLDEKGDPYSIREGFFHAYIGWTLFRTHVFDSENVKDLAENKLIEHQHKHYLAWAFSAGILSPIILGTMTHTLLQSIFLNIIVRTTIVHHSAFVINSFCHSFGKSTYDASSSAKDFWPAAFITYGEAFHSFHHRFPYDYRNGVEWYHWDPTKWLIRFLEFSGAAWDLKRAPDHEISTARHSLFSRI